MRRQYMTPTATLTQVELMNMIAGSVKGQTVYTDEDAGTDVEGLSRRRRTVWDDEEEEDDNDF